MAFSGSETLSPLQARRIALGAQGFSGARPNTVSTRRMHTVIERMGALQIDSVNVFARSHYMPVFSRLGGYDRDALDQLLFGGRSRYVEYVAHEAALIPAEDWGLWQFRMDRFRERYGAPGTWMAENAAFLDELKEELASRGPLRPSRSIWARSAETAAPGGIGMPSNAVWRCCGGLGTWPSPDGADSKGAAHWPKP